MDTREILFHYWDCGGVRIHNHVEFEIRKHHVNGVDQSRFAFHFFHVRERCLLNRNGSKRKGFYSTKRSLNLLVVATLSNDVQLFLPTLSLPAFTLVAEKDPEPVTKQFDPILNDLMEVS